MYAYARREHFTFQARASNGLIEYCVVADMVVGLVGLRGDKLLLLSSFVAQDAPGNSSSSSLNLSCTQSLLRN